MRIKLHSDFKKLYKKLSKKDQQKIDARLTLFMSNPFTLVLNNHLLNGKWNGYRSIDIKGDLRALYKVVNDQECIFIALGNHNNLYS